MQDILNNKFGKWSVISYEGKKKDIILKELEEEMKSSGIILVKKEEIEDEKTN